MPRPVGRIIPMLECITVWIYEHNLTNKVCYAAIACILANGTNYGLYKMANISDRSMGKLRSVDDSYIRYETLTQSNDKVSNAIATLPIFAYYHVDDNQLFSSIDGQKFECHHLNKPT